MYQYCWICELENLQETEVRHLVAAVADYQYEKVSRLTAIYHFVLQTQW